MEPVSIALNLFSTGGAEFEVRYTGRPGVVVFPFPAADVAKLRFDGGAAVTSHVLVNPSTRAQTAAVGQLVRVTYRSGDNKKHAVTRVDGRLISSGDAETVLATAEGVLSVRGELVETLLVLNPDEGGLPQLQLQYDADTAGDLDLAVSGFDPTLRYSVQHSLVLEPDVSVAGRTPASMAVAAQLMHTYPWSIRVDKITLTEFEALPVQHRHAYEEAEGATFAAVRSAKSAPPEAQSANSGAISIQRPVRLARTAVGPTVVQVARMKLNRAEAHYLATLDPTQTSEDARFPLEFVVRLKPETDTFVPSGPAAVLIDMDPAPGPAHLAPADLHLGFYHNAWDSKNRRRAYHRLGPTTQLTARIEETSVKSVTDDATGRTTVQHRLVMTNATPYPAHIKLWLTSRSTLYSVIPSDEQSMKIEGITDSYVRETEDQVAAANTYTLQLALPVLSGQAEASCVLTVVYNRY